MGCSLQLWVSGYPFLPVDEQCRDYFAVNVVLSYVEDPELCAMSARKCEVVSMSLEETNADKVQVLLQAQSATSQRPNHTRQGVCNTQAGNVSAVYLTEAAGSRMNQRDRSKTGLQGAAVRSIKVYLLACAHVDDRSVGSFGRKS